MRFREPVSIYQQIIDHVVAEIIDATRPVGARLPSVREYAVEIGVNPNTVQRAYAALLERGLAVNQRGVGYFVADDAPARARAELAATLRREELPRLCRRMRRAGLGPEEFQLVWDSLNTPEGEDR